MATFDDFQKLDIRVGRVIKVEDLPEAHKPLYKIAVEFGQEIDVKRSAMGATHLYSKEQLKNKLILGLVNLEPKQIGPFTSEFLTLGVSDDGGRCILIAPDQDVSLGAKLY